MGVFRALLCRISAFAVNEAAPKSAMLYSGTIGRFVLLAVVQVRRIESKFSQKIPTAQLDSGNYATHTRVRKIAPCLLGVCGECAATVVMGEYKYANGLYSENQKVVEPDALR
jgi:hypothetical protein